MADSLSRTVANSRPLQLAVTALLSSAVAVAIVLGVQHRSRDVRSRYLKRSVAAVAEMQAHPAHGGDGSGNGNVNGSGSMGALGADEVVADAEERRALALAHRALSGDYSEEVVLEQLTRTQAFLTTDGLARVRAAFVVVVGCGGVGSHCAAALARSGVGRLRLIDFDQVTLSSLNRHAVATLADVGRPKVSVLARRLRMVTPWVCFDTRVAKFEESVANILLGAWDDNDDGQTPTIVVDAIDNIDSKVSLLRYCHDHSLSVVAAMGAATKSDPTKIAVADLAASAEDRLARATRRRLKLLGVTAGIPAVYSSEATADGKATLLPLPDEQYARLGSAGVRELGALPDFRVRILPVLGTMPAIFGNTVANHILLSLSGYPYEYAAIKGRDKLYDQILAAVHGFEERLVRHREAQSQPPPTTSDAVGLRVALTVGDIAFLLEEVYHGRSAISGLPTRTTLVRWALPTSDDGTSVNGLVDRVITAPSSAAPAAFGANTGGTDALLAVQRSTRLRLDDLVCMTREEANRHQAEVLLGGQRPEDLYDAATLARIEAHRKDANAWEPYRW